MDLTNMMQVGKVASWREHGDELTVCLKCGEFTE